MSGADKADCAVCAICGRWPKALRPAMRPAINVLPLQEPVCAECMKAFWADITTKTRAKGQRPT
jgi:hypothetical protein